MRAAVGEAAGVQQGGREDVVFAEGDILLLLNKAGVEDGKDARIYFIGVVEGIASEESVLG